MSKFTSVAFPRTPMRCLLSVLLMIFTILPCPYWLVSCSLPEIPDHVRIDSKLAISSPDDIEILHIEEFVEKSGGNVHVKVNSMGKEYNSYYRIGESNNNVRHPSIDRVIQYSEEDNLCVRHSTTDWQLNSLSRLFESLRTIPKPNHFSLKPISQDRTAIGPTGLLRFFYENAKLLRADLRAFDQEDLVDAYYFSTVVDSGQGNSIKLVAMIAAPNVRDRGSITVNMTSLWDVDTIFHISKIIVLFLDEEAAKKNLRTQLTMNTIRQMSVSYLLVQDISRDNPLSTINLDQTESNPFLLPIGVGCGIVSDHQLFYIQARQFSGRYEADDFNGEHSVAFDEHSAHLRLDWLGEHKLIYDLSQRFTVYVSRSSRIVRSTGSNGEFEDELHCLRATLYPDEERESRLYNVNSMSDILGFGPNTGLSYLGTTSLEDGSRCLVFERELVADQVPVLALLNLRLRYTPAARFFMVYYLVIGGSDNEKEDYFAPLHGHKLMRLKRMELRSKRPFSKYSTSNSRITFIESSWTLESIAEDDRLSNLMHPARAFDISECRSKHEHIVLRLAIEQSNTSDPNSGLIESSSYETSSLIGAEPLEEGMMSFLTRRLRISRMSVNELKLVLPERSNTVLVEAKLSLPPSFTLDRKLVGWLKSINSAVVNQSVLMITIHEHLSRTECLLSAGVKFLNSERKLTIVFCPNFGCGYIPGGLDDGSVDYIKKNNSTPDAKESWDQFYLCELYASSKSASQDVLAADRLSARGLERSLGGASVVFDIAPGTRMADESKKFCGTVRRVTSSKPDGHESMASLLRSGFCYNDKDTVEDKDLRTVQVQLQMHQSLIQCVKACHLFAECLTFSYDKSTKLCTLTNIDAEYFKNEIEPYQDGVAKIDGVLRLRGSAYCKIYTLNSFHLYRTHTRLVYNSMSSLTRMGYHFVLGNLNDCANMCHQFELVGNATDVLFECQQFIHLRLVSLCAVPDINSYLLNLTLGHASVVNMNTRAEYNRKLVDAEIDWFVVHKWHTYQRDFEQYYTMKASTTLVISRPTYKTPDGISKASFEGATHSILYDLDYNRCLYECSVLNWDCVAVDYCFGALNKVTGKSCIMYHIRSPFSLQIDRDRGRLPAGAAESSSLTDLEKLYYVDGKSDDHNVSISTTSCLHHYLSGDYLTLKRQITPDSSYMVETHVSKQHDNSISSNFIKIRDHSVAALDSSSWIMLSQFSMLMIGLLTGAIIFVSTSKLSIKWNELPNLETLRSSLGRLVRSSRERSLSQIELGDLGDMELDN